MAESSYQDIIKLGKRAKDGRGQWLSHWEELAEVFLPNRVGFHGSFTEGEEKGTHNYTDVPQLARRGFATSIAAMMRPAGKTWFKAQMRNKGLHQVPVVRTWLDIVTQITYDHIYHSAANMERKMSEADNDLATFGWNAVKVGWDPDNRHLTYKTYHPKSVVIMRDSFGNPDACWIFMMWPLRNIVEMFGADNLPREMKKELTGGTPNLDKPFEIAHACVPNKDWNGQFRPGDKQSGRAPRMPYLSLWYACAEQHPLDVGGFETYPYIHGEWDTSAGEDYARGPASVALDSARLANAITRDLHRAGANSAVPPLGAWSDFIAGNAVNLYSGGLTLFDAQGNWERTGNPIWPIETGAMPQEIFQLLEGTLENVKQAFYLHILELPPARDTNMTATEVNARYDEFLRNGSPTFSRVEQNYNGAHLNRVFDILLREGEYPPAPEIILGEDIEFEYESPLKQMRKKGEALKVAEGLGMISEMAMTLGPEKAAQVSENFNPDQIARYLSEALDIPEHLMTPIEQMMQMREQRTQQMQMMQMAEMANKAAPAVAAAGNLPNQLLGAGSPMAEGGALQGQNVPAVTNSGLEEAGAAVEELFGGGDIDEAA